MKVLASLMAVMFIASNAFAITAYVNPRNDTQRVAFDVCVTNPALYSAQGATERQTKNTCAKRAFGHYHNDIDTFHRGPSK